MMETGRIRLTGVLIAIVALVCLACAATASAESVTSTHVTTPADGSLFLEEAASPSEITISGTAEGSEIEALDIRCYAGDGSSTELEEVEPKEEGKGTGKYKFTFKDAPEELGEAPCVLRAVPTTEAELLPPGTPTKFEGPQVADSEFLRQKDAADSTVFGYGIEARTLSTIFEIDAAGTCGLGPTYLVSSPGLTSGDELFRCAGAVANLAGSGTRAAIQVDSRNVYDPYAADTLWNEFKQPTPPPGVTVEKPAFDKTAGLKTLQESDPLVRCEGKEVTYPETAASCEKFVPAGITLKRTWTISDGGRLITIADSWQSTDAARHSVNVIYTQELGSDTASPGTFQLPGGTAAFATTKTGESISLPGGDGAILYREDGTAPETVDGAHPVGAITLGAPPSGPAQVTSGSAETGGYDALTMPYDFEVPAAGTSELTMGFAEGYTLAEVCKLAEEAKSGCRPSVAITTPADGSKSSSASLVLTGTASDAVGLSSVHVNGQAASLSGSKWSATVPLKAGTNTITAEATNHAGFTRSTSITVNYNVAEEEAAAKKKAEEEAAAKVKAEAEAAAKKKAEEAAVPLATTVGKATLVKGNITLVLACSGPAGTSCSVSAALTTVEKLRAGRPSALTARSRTVTVAGASAGIAAGSRRTITLKLNATGRSLLGHFHKLPLHLEVLQAGVSKALASVLTETLTLTVKHG